MKLSDLPGIRSQRDPQWSSVELGFNTDPEFNIGNYGCLVTSMANYCWAIDRANLTTSNPGLLNNALKETGGFVPGGGNINWAGFNSQINTDILPQGVTSDIHTLADWLNRDNCYALIQVTGSHGGYTFPEHWLMGYGVTAGTGAPDALDPWFGDFCEVQGRYTFVLAHLYGDGAPLTATSSVPETQAIVPQPQLDTSPTEPEQAAPAQPPQPTPTTETPPISSPSVTPLFSTTIGRFALGVVATGLTPIIMNLQNFHTNDLGLATAIIAGVTVLTSIKDLLNSQIKNTPKSKS